MTRHSGNPGLPGNRLARYSRREVAVMVTVMIAGAIGLARLSFHVMKPRPGASADGDPRRVEVERWDVAQIFIPKAFVDIAKNTREGDLPVTHEDIKTFLINLGQEKAWYAMITLAHQSDGNGVFMPAYCRPFETSVKPSEFRAVLATLQGNPPRWPQFDFSKAEISIIPEELENGDPGEGTTELIRRWELAESRAAQ